MRSRTSSPPSHTVVDLLSDDSPAREKTKPGEEPSSPSSPQPGSSKDKTGGGGKRKLVYNPPLTREQEDELAEAIHGCPDIWDKKKDGHRNVDTVSRFFDSMNKKYFNGKKDGAQNWLKSQRRNLTEAMRKQKLHSGDDGEEPHLQPKEAWAVSKLAFVRPQVINEINTVNCFLFVCV